jgi:phosphoribosyl 1,2-cyclic phosphate phosphodiesterase
LSVSYRFTLLGCGSSTGVPRVGNDWGQCDPSEPKNRRRRCSALYEQRGRDGTTLVLIDTGPDCREQLLSVRVTSLDAVLYTHDHADHTHGIDDLRMLAYASRRRIPVWANAATMVLLEKRFDYCFKQPEGSSYPPILTANLLDAPGHVTIAGAGGPVEVDVVPQQHGDIASLGFRFGGLAYSPDVSGLTDAAAAQLEGLDVWIVDALRPQPHPSHFSVKQALEWIARLKPKRAILTHLHIDLDYQTLRRDLPPSVEPAYDGLVIEG